MLRIAVQSKGRLYDETMMLLEEAGILEYEKVQIVDINNGNRFETYTIAGERGSGIICLNGAAAHKGKVGDRLIVMAFAQMTPEEAKGFIPAVKHFYL